MTTNNNQIDTSTLLKHLKDCLDWMERRGERDRSPKNYVFHGAQAAVRQAENALTPRYMALLACVLTRSGTTNN